MTMLDIARDFAAENDVDLSVLLSRTRLSKITALRQELMWILRSVQRNGLPRYNWNQIGRFLDRDHGTIRHGVEVHEKRLSE
jgi:chromosomal replication initiation ATPase DnaA